MSEHVNNKSEQKQKNSAHFVSEARALLGMTQLEFAEAIGISRNYVYMLENGVKPLTLKMKARIDQIEKQSCSPYSNLRSSGTSPPDAPLSAGPLCHYPGEIPARMEVMERRLSTIEHDLATITAQMETITGLLSAALGAGLKKSEHKKAG